MEDLQDIWAGLLSGNEAEIRQIWDDLTDDEASAVSAYLRKMAEDPNFSQEQRQAAQRALQAILKAG